MAKAKSALHSCGECGLHYKDQAVAKQCAEWCKQHQSCNMQIAKLADENRHLTWHV